MNQKNSHPYINLWQIYSGHCTPNFIRIGHHTCIRNMQLHERLSDHKYLEVALADDDVNI